MENALYLLKKENLKLRMYLVRIAVNLESIHKNIENIKKGMFEKLLESHLVPTDRREMTGPQITPEELAMVAEEPPLDSTQPPLTLVPKRKAGRPPGSKNKTVKNIIT